VNATLVTKEHTYLKEIQSRVVELKAQGNCEDARAIADGGISGEISDWDHPGWIADAVRRFYAESN